MSILLNRLRFGQLGEKKAWLQSSLYTQKSTSDSWMIWNGVSHSLILLIAFVTRLPVLANARVSLRPSWHEWAEEQVTGNPPFGKEAWLSLAVLSKNKMILWRSYDMNLGNDKTLVSRPSSSLLAWSLVSISKQCFALITASNLNDDDSILVLGKGYTNMEETIR